MLLWTAKNTTQSVAADGCMSNESNDRQPSLPDGRIIDGKNTLQSFALPSISEHWSGKGSDTPVLLPPTYRNSSFHHDTAH